LLEAGPRQAFAEADFFEKILLQPADLLIEEVVALVDDAEGDIGDDFGGAGFDDWQIGLIPLPICF
jgi:hypothetical protein